LNGRRKNISYKQKHNTQKEKSTNKAHNRDRHNTQMRKTHKQKQQQTMKNTLRINKKKDSKQTIIGIQHVTEKTTTE
jgi:hypothetical protein